MKIFGLETTGSFTGDISGSVGSTGLFGSLILEVNIQEYKVVQA